ncbi:MAG TPA: alpha/beta hydrolase [Burkholderiaceae bacterium]|nr:alpha/beta hydrolase [Burkholderiaceae bacterium]
MTNSSLPHSITKHAELGASGTLDPQIEEVLRLIERAGRPAYQHLGARQARIEYEKAARVLEIAPVTVHRVENLVVEHADLRIPVRLYWPREPNAWDRLPALVLAHGGGFTVGSVDTIDSIARLVCRDADCCVMSVDYRLAPEHPFPAAFDDVWAVLRFAFEQAGALGLDAARIAVGGDSAGGTLAAACAIAARDHDLPLALQWLIYPGTEAEQNTRSHHAYAKGYLLQRETILWFFAHYLRDHRDRFDWRFAPLHALDVRGVAPAWIAVAEFDPLVDEGVSYACRLMQNDVPTELAFYPGAVHAFFNMGGRVKLARRAHADAIVALRKAFTA